MVCLSFYNRRSNITHEKLQVRFHTVYASLLVDSSLYFPLKKTLRSKQYNFRKGATMNDLLFLGFHCREDIVHYLVHGGFDELHHLLH